ncbi:MAG: mevalonate kinase [Deltaproteobacteria bacterium]|nr:mevalonate kinase [Deltaproteobacteria bacterium]
MLTPHPGDRPAREVLGHGEAPGKVILLGEHSVVYGHPAIAAALSRGVRVSIESNDEGPTFRAPRWGVATVLADAPDVAPLGVALERVRRAVAPGLTRVAAVAEDRLPLGAGLGSSAALTVATARAFAAAAGTTLTAERLTQVCHLAEQVFHGNPSGVDQATVVHGGILRFQRPPGGTPDLRALKPPQPMTLVVALMRPHVGTKEAVEGLRARRERHKRTFEALLHELGALAQDGVALLEQADWAGLGERMDLAHGLLHALGVSSDDLDQLVRLGRNHGALGAKLTGAGIGGAVVMLTDGDLDHTRRLVLALRAHGAQAFSTEVV